MLFRSGYLEPGKFENMSESERNTMLDECFSYNDELRKNGHWVAFATCWSLLNNRQHIAGIDGQALGGEDLLHLAVFG